MKDLTVFGRQRNRGVDYLFVNNNGKVAVLEGQLDRTLPEFTGRDQAQDYLDTYS